MGVCRISHDARPLTSRLFKTLPFVFSAVTYSERCSHTLSLILIIKELFVDSFAEWIYGILHTCLSLYLSRSSIYPPLVVNPSELDWIAYNKDNNPLYVEMFDLASSLLRIRIMNGTGCRVRWEHLVTQDTRQHRERLNTFHGLRQKKAICWRL